MNEEEKEAIEYIKNCLDNEYNFKNATSQKDKDAYNVILSLINKQQKEIEKLRNPIICGRSIDEIVRILNGLDIEKQYKIDVTMENLKSLMDLYQNEVHKQMAMSFESIRKDILNPDVSGCKFTLTIPKFKFKEDTEDKNGHRR